MNKLLLVLIAAMFSAFTVSVVAADTTASGAGAEASKTQTVKHAKKHHRESRTREMIEERGENKKQEMNDTKETKAQEMQEK